MVDIILFRIILRIHYHHKLSNLLNIGCKCIGFHKGRDSIFSSANASLIFSLNSKSSSKNCCKPPIRIKPSGSFKIESYRL